MVWWLMSLAAVGFEAVQANTTAPSAAPMSSAAACPALLNHKFDRLQDEKPQSLCQYAGKVVLVVNTASFCGFTSQYEGLEALYAKYQARGLVVLGFPSNDFGQQEPGNAKQIADVCFNTFGVKFPMFEKTVRATSTNSTAVGCRKVAEVAEVAATGCGTPKPSSDSVAPSWRLRNAARWRVTAASCA